MCFKLYLEYTNVFCEGYHNSEGYRLRIFCFYVPLSFCQHFKKTCVMFPIMMAKLRNVHNFAYFSLVLTSKMM